jgi:chemotaxis protein MotB
VARQPKYFQAESGKHDRWLISYVDIVTILLILFIAAAAHGVQLTPARPLPTPVVVVPQPSVAPPPPTVPPAEIPPALLEAKHKLELQGVDVQVRQRGLWVSLPQAVLFASGDDGLSSTALPVISGIADVLRDLPSNKITLIGHADAKPMHGTRFRNNWDLSAARSLRILDVMTGRYGISEERLSVSSEGSQNPKGRNDTEEGRAANRRVEIVIQGDDEIIVPAAR